MKRFPGQNRLVQGDSEIVQDGPKRPLLCDGCEQMLGTSERLFNNQFLTPYYKAKIFQAEYGPWLATFAAANIWRVLITSIEDAQIPAGLNSTAAAAERAWRAFIRNESPDCAPHNLHLVLIDNRPEWAAYAEGAIEYSVVADESAGEAYLITKLPGLAMIGILCERNDRSWSDTKIHPAGGSVNGSADARWPDLIGRYFRRQIETSNRTIQVNWS